MERWLGCLAVVTGVSAGMGAAISEKLVKNGINVVGIARKLENVQELSESLEGEAGLFYPVECDLTDKNSIEEAFLWIEKNLGAISILINNAALLIPSTLTDCETPSRLKKFFFSCHNSNNLNGTLVLSDGTIEDWKAMLDVNVLALCICTMSAVQSMKKHNIDGHIVNINGTAGDYVPNVSQFSVYPASKHAVKAFSESLRQELIQDGRKIKISSVSPGLVQMEPQRSFDSSSGADGTPVLLPENVAEVVAYVLGTPAHVEVQDMVVRVIGEK